MRSLWREFPDDADAGVLFAEALMDLRPWDLWTAKGQPRPGTEEIISVLESGFPDHPGACHYDIHAVEASPTPERALYGLMRSLRAQKKTDEAEEVERQFKAAWTHADVTLTGSRF